MAVIPPELTVRLSAKMSPPVAVKSVPAFPMFWIMLFWRFRFPESVVDPAERVPVVVRLPPFQFQSPVKFPSVIVLVPRSMVVALSVAVVMVIEVRLSIELALAVIF